MPQPTSRDVHIDRALTNMSVAYLQDHRDYLAERIFPRLPVLKQSDSYFEYDRGFWFRDEAQLRGPGTESAGGGYGVSQKTYRAEVYAFHQDLDPQTIANTDNPLDADRDAAEYVTEKVLLKREKIVVAKYFTTGIWTGSTTGSDIVPGTLWSATGSKPIDDVDAQSESIKKKTAKWPNRFVLGAQVFRNLKNHADVLDRIKYTQKATVSPELLASLFAPPLADNFEVLVAAAIENTAKEGATDSMAFLADPQDALLCYAEPSPGLRKPSAGYIFTWTGLLGGNAAFGNRILNIPTPLLGEGSYRVEGEIAFDAKVVAADLGTYFNEAVA